MSSTHCSILLLSGLESLPLFLEQSNHIPKPRVTSLYNANVHKCTYACLSVMQLTCLVHTVQFRYCTVWSRSLFFLSQSNHIPKPRVASLYNANVHKCTYACLSVMQLTCLVHTVQFRYCMVWSRSLLYLGQSNHIPKPSVTSLLFRAY